jgi:hypothetical protein
MGLPAARMSRATCSGVAPALKLSIQSASSRPVDLEKGEHGDECYAIAVDEPLPLCDPVRKHGGLEGEIGILVVGVGSRSCDRGAAGDDDCRWG